MADARVLTEAIAQGGSLPRGARRLRHLTAALLPLLLSACPQPAETCGEGPACAEGQRCEAGVCVASMDGGDGGPAVACAGEPIYGLYDNLLADPGFECSPDSAQWWAQEATLTPEAEVVRSGSKALRLATPPEGPNAIRDPSMWSKTEVKVTESGTYCAAVWMRGSADTVRLNVRRVTPGGQGDDISIPGFPKPDAWVRIPTEGFGEGALGVLAQKGDTLLVRVSLQDAVGGESVALDDAVLWRAPNGDCRKR